MIAVKRTPYVLMAGLVMLFGAVPSCGMYTYVLTPEAPAASTPLKTGDDCVPVILGLGVGTMTADAAARQGGITTVKEVAVNEYYVLIAGMRCVTVRGE